MNVSVTLRSTAACALLVAAPLSALADASVDRFRAAYELAGQMELAFILGRLPELEGQLGPITWTDLHEEAAACLLAQAEAELGPERVEEFLLAFEADAAAEVFEWPKSEPIGEGPWSDPALFMAMIDCDFPSVSEVPGGEAWVALYDDPLTLLRLAAE